MTALGITRIPLIMSHNTDAVLFVYHHPLMLTIGSPCNAIPEKIYLPDNDLVPCIYTDKIAIV